MTDESQEYLNWADQLKLYPSIEIDKVVGKIRDKLKCLLEDVTNETDKEGKGKLLEQLVKLLFESPYLRFKKERHRCEAGEVDLVFTVRRYEGTLFYEFSYFLIIECKNWSTKPGKVQVNDFLAKMRSTNSKIGFFISTEGVTRDAVRIIRDAWKVEKMAVLVFDGKDLKKIVESSINLFDLLEEKYLSVVTGSKEK